MSNGYDEIRKFIENAKQHLVDMPEYQGASPDQQAKMVSVFGIIENALVTQSTSKLASKDAFWVVESAAFTVGLKTSQELAACLGYAMSDARGASPFFAEFSEAPKQAFYQSCILVIMFALAWLAYAEWLKNGGDTIRYKNPLYPPMVQERLHKGFNLIQSSLPVPFRLADIQAPDEQKVYQGISHIILFLGEVK